MKIGSWRFTKCCKVDIATLAIVYVGCMHFSEFSNKFVGLCIQCPWLGQYLRLALEFYYTLASYVIIWDTLQYFISHLY